MVHVLAVSDEVDERLCAAPGLAGDAEVILACGDLPFDYLRCLMDVLDIPLVFVPGNHDPDVSGYRRSRAGLTLRAGMPARVPWPPGAVNVDGTVAEVCGMRIAGLGGSLRYHDGPNQYSERQQTWRARRLIARAGRGHRRDARPLDVLLTHAPPRGVGDGDDLPHRGFAALHLAIERLQPAWLLHGHVHPYGAAAPDTVVGSTRVRNVVGRHQFEIGESNRVYTGHCAPPDRVPES